MARYRPSVTDFIEEDISAMNDHLIKVTIFDLGATDMEMISY